MKITQKMLKSCIIATIVIAFSGPLSAMNQSLVSSQGPTDQLIALCKSSGPESTLENARQLLKEGAIITQGEPLSAFYCALVQGRADLCELFFDELLEEESSDSALHDEHESLQELKRCSRAFVIAFARKFTTIRT